MEVCSAKANSFESLKNLGDAFLSHDSLVIFIEHQKRPWALRCAGVFEALL
jgi:hypothetical protein